VFSTHLHKLSEPQRASVLQRRGSKNNHRFRFSNPMLQPYVIMRGLESEILQPATFDALMSSPS